MLLYFIILKLELLDSQLKNIKYNIIYEILFMKYMHLPKQIFD